MAVITGKVKLSKTLDFFRENGLSMAVFATGSHWNTEAILLAASRFARKYDIRNIPVGLAITYNYEHMPQARRITYEGNPRHGFLSIMEHLRILCNSDDSQYYNAMVFPHLDHADPVKDEWALTEGLPYLSSVMFDAQKYKYEDNVEMTSDYLGKFGSDVLVEGIVDELAVSGALRPTTEESFVEKAVDYFTRTRVDLLVANLGTEQQSVSVGKCTYLPGRAQDISRKLGKAVLVLHGTSCLQEHQLGDLIGDGIIRLNIWSRIAREAGQYSARKVLERITKIEEGDFEAAESRQYLRDSTMKAEQDMGRLLEAIGYRRLAGMAF